MPATVRAFAPVWQKAIMEADRKATHMAKTAKERCDSKTSHLSQLKIGQKVRVQHHVTKRWTICGTVLWRESNRVYGVRLASGLVLVRNRKFLRSVVELKQLEPSSSDSLSEKIDGNDHGKSKNKKDNIPVPSTRPRPSRARKPPSYLQDYDH